MKTALHRLLDFLESSRRSLFVPAALLLSALVHVGASAQAHHVFPVKFKNKFENKFGIKIDDAENGVWLDSHKHLSGAWKYNMEWDDFFEKNPNATKEDVMEFARKLMVETYGETVNF